MKQIVWTLIAVMILLLAGTVVFIFSGTYNVAASIPHSGFEHWLFETITENSIEARADDTTSLDLADSDLIQRGFVHYDAMCVTCHGAPGVSPAEIGEGLNPAPPPLVEASDELDPSEIFWIVKNGLKFSGMPAFGETHSDDDLWAIVAFVNHLPHLGLYDYLNLRETLRPPDSAGTHGTTPHAH